MKVFKSFNTNGRPCFICNTKAKKETVLVIKEWTIKNHIGEAMQVHLECLPELSFNPDLEMFYIRMEDVYNQKGEVIHND